MEALRSRLINLLAAPKPGLEEINAFFAELNADTCTSLVRTIDGNSQKRLWEAAAGRPVKAEDLVPTSYEAAQEVIHWGRNSLPLFHQFQKRFSRVEGDEAILYGYNEGSLRWLIGPGYFVARHDEASNSLCVDYHSIPPKDAKLPEGWPQLAVNDRGVSQLVFGGMIDYLRKISDRVFVGRAERGGKLQNNYFLLCRSEREP